MGSFSAYRSLTLFCECIPRIELCVWWNVSHCRPHLVKATQSVIKLICGQFRHVGTSVRSRHCQLCDTWEADDVPHLLFKCNQFSGQRNQLWDNVLNSMPEPMSHHVLNLNVNDKARFLLSGFNVSFTREWLDVYGAVAIFASSLYNKKVTQR